MAILPGMGPRNQLPGGSGQPATGAADRVATFRMGGVLKYAFLPEIAPRIKRLGKSFGHFAYMLAMVFRSVRLLPPNHPMLISSNIGRFGIVDVISAAANNLVVSKKNTDQILIFGAIVMAIIMIVVQVAIIGFYSVMLPGTANAADDGMFRLSSSAAEEDVVMTFLQQTIGLDNFFNSKVPLGSFNIAAGLRAMLGFYSTGLMLIATCIVVYYVITVVGESAQSGTPFGRRFNGLWAPVRLVLALGLLVPLGNGLNAAQYTALYIAKAGSSFATQGWNKFTAAVANPSNIIADTYPTGFSKTVKEIFMYEVCAAAYNLQQKDPNNRIVINRASPQSGTIGGDYIPSGGEEFGIVGTMSPVENIKYYSFDWKIKTSSTGGRSAQFSCGSLKISVLASKTDAAGRAVSEVVLPAYAEAIYKTIGAVRPVAEKYAKRITAFPGNTDYNAATQLPEPAEVAAAIQVADNVLYERIIGGSEGYKTAVAQQVLSDDDWKKGGWGNAATFYLKVAFANQKTAEIISGSAPVPDVSASPQAAVEGVISSEKTADDNRSYWQWLAPEILGGRAAPPLSNLGTQADAIKAAMVRAHNELNAWIPATSASLSSNNKIKNLRLGDSWDSSNPIYRAVKEFFAIEEINALVDPDQQNVFPMVRLSKIGGALITKAAWAFGAGLAASLLSTAVANMIFFIGLLGLGIGFLLYYVLPFMPFIYFFFAIVEWVMGVLESMVGAPLWALAHLRIDGEGMPGQAAMQGYNILLGILLRPTLILFGLIGSYICFNSAANFLNLIFWGSVGVRTNGGADVGAFGYIGYVLVYAIIVYNLGLVCFKMIDQIPNQALRWMSISDGTYKDGKSDPIGNVSGAAMTAGTLMSGQVASNAAQMGGALGSLGKGAASKGLGSMRGGAAGKGKASSKP